MVIEFTYPFGYLFKLLYWFILSNTLHGIRWLDHARDYIVFMCYLMWLNHIFMESKKFFFKSCP